MSFIPKKHFQITFGFFMAFFTSMVMSFLMTVINVGIVDHFTIIWLKTWATAFLIVFAITPFMMAFAKKVTERVTY